MTPDDVYALVTREIGALRTLIWWAAGIVILLICLQIGIKIKVFSRFWRQLRRLDGLLRLAELHGEITDAQAVRMRAIAHDEFKHLLAVKDEVTEVKGKADDIERKVTAVKDVVDKTAPLVIAAMAEHPSGTAMPPGVLSPPAPIDPRNPPKRRAEDKA